jgi:hypothetical protein
MLLAMTITKQRIKFGFSRKVAPGVTSHLDAGLGVFPSCSSGILLFYDFLKLNIITANTPITPIVRSTTRLTTRFLGSTVSIVDGVKGMLVGVEVSDGVAVAVDREVVVNNGVESIMGRVDKANVSPDRIGVTV